MPRVTYESVLHNTEPYKLEQLSLASLSWFRDEMKRIKRNRYNKQAFIVGGKQDTVRRLEIGKVYMFSYVPKYSNADIVGPTNLLPIYDRYPLVIPFSTAPNGFYAVNLHYLPIKIRAWLLDQLLRTANYKSNRLRVTWALLKNFSRAKVGEYATHRYLLNHITSPFRLVRIEDYPNAIMLPLAGWYGTNRALVAKRRKGF